MIKTKYIKIKVKIIQKYIDKDKKVVQAKQILEIGDIKYLSGSTTKVKIIGNEDTLYPKCEILEAYENSKYFKRIGMKFRISRQILYKYNRRGKKTKKMLSS